MSTEITIEESDFANLVNIEPEFDSLRISNSINAEIDVVRLIEHLKSIKGIQCIKDLTIGYDSTLKNLNVLSAFPNLRTLSIYGQYIISFEGIEWFVKGQYIKIETYRNKRRDISQLSLTKVKSINIEVERLEDLSAIAECKHLTNLDLYRSMEVDFTQWTDVPFEFIAFKEGSLRN